MPNSIADLAETPGGQLKTWSRTIQEDLALLGEPRVYGLRRWDREWQSICIEMTQDRRAWSAIVRDAVNPLESGVYREGAVNLCSVNGDHCGGNLGRNWPASIAFP